MSPDTSNYTIDPQGNMIANGAPGFVDVTGGGSSSLGSLAPKPSSDPYSIFNNALTSMLTQATNQSANNNALLTGAKNNLSTLSVAPNGPQPFNPQVSSASQVGAQENLQNSFNPAITSISDQEANTAAAMEGIKGTISQIQSATQPVTLSPGQSLVTRDGTVIQGSGQYAPTGQVDENGIPTFYNVKTGQIAGNTGSGTTPPTDQTSLVGGVDFSGASTGSKSYATDPQYNTKVDNMYNQIVKSNPIPSAQGLDQFIQGHIGGKSPVTGSMIINAATLYGIDPNILAATLGLESDFGTAGAGVKTMNPGNVGNTGTNTQTFKSWSDGVNAAANELAIRMPGNKNAGVGVASNGASDINLQSNNATSPVGGQFSPEATQKLAQLSPGFQKYADAGPLGIAYINADKVSSLPAATQAAIQVASAKAGIPFVQAADVSGIKSIQSVLSNLDSMQALAMKTLSGGKVGSTMGHLNDWLLGGVNQLLQTSWGQNLGLFDNYRDTAIKAVQALAGGAGSGLRINGAEIAANTQNLPQASDSIQNATKQIQQLKQMIYVNLANTFPYATAKVVAPDGTTGSMPIGNLSQAITQGYSVK